MIHILLIAIGGFLGSICRFIATTFIKRKFSYSFPVGTFFVNLIGSFLLGFLYGVNSNIEVIFLIGTGFLGAFTTFSTFKLETIQLVESRRRITSFIYLSLTYIGGIFFAFVGFLLGSI